MEIEANDTPHIQLAPNQLMFRIPKYNTNVMVLLNPKDDKIEVTVLFDENDIKRLGDDVALEIQEAVKKEIHNEILE